MLKVLVVDDDQGLRESVKAALLSHGGIEVEEAFDGLDAMEKIKAGKFNMILLDVDMPRLTGKEALPLIKEHDPSITVIIMTAYATIDDAVSAVKNGAFNYLQKPVKSDELLALIEKAQKAHLMLSNAVASAPVLMQSGRKIIGNSQQMKRVFSVIDRVSKVDTPVLIRGASGTGKELVARAIHFNSSRKDDRFVAINCSAIPDNLFESELFGHEKGSFTGADARKIGKFQYAEGGTLFLDEVGDLPMMAQVKLLRVLQEKIFTPVGSNREIEANVRIIAATNRPLEQMIKDNKYRDDLFYRLNVIPIFLPELKDRKNDLGHLVNIFIKKFNKAHSRKIAGMTNEAMNVLQKYDWPGNIRELENVIEHAFIWETSAQLSISSLPENILNAAGISLPEIQAQSEEAASAAAGEPNNGVEGGNTAEIATGEIAAANSEASGTPSTSAATQEIVTINGDQLDFNKHKEAFEREFIVKALTTFKGRINQTALHANIPKKTLLRKIEKYGINTKDYMEN